MNRNQALFSDRGLAKRRVPGEGDPSLRPWLAVRLRRVPAVTAGLGRADQHDPQGQSVRQGLRFTRHVRGTLNSDVFDQRPGRQLNAMGFRWQAVAGVFVETIVFGIVGVAADQSVPFP